METFNKSLSVVMLEPRRLDDLDLVARVWVERLQTLCINYEFVFYCGKGDGEYWRERFPKEFEIKELDVNNFATSEAGCGYSDFFKREEFWKTFKYDFVLTIQGDTWPLDVVSLPGYMDKNWAYIGGNQPEHEWNVFCKAMGYTGAVKTFNGGLSLRRRDAMLRVLEEFPPSITQFNSTVHTEMPEDAYFVFGCIKLGLNIGENDPAARYFCVHNDYTSFEYDFVAAHKPFREIPMAREYFFHLYPMARQNRYL
ncbi:hypothetical protein PBCVCviKI_071R [Paramecium bursaria Chlorella virus CviKI]|nr:hypothetical protein PBCVCviKI_071R [Paramecium bursaria Chlorella virus CviKI]AGE55152.1 hypothetical protein PBCVMA1E_072R [Paramecium bursaria Chlorella virus MA1E]